MKTVSELGKKTKERYPEYSDMTDEECGRAVKEAYPGLYDDYVEGHELMLKGSSSLVLNDFENSLAELTRGMTDLQIDPKTEQNLQVLLDYYRPDRGVFTSWWQRRKSEGRTKMAVQVSTEYLEVIRQGQLLEEAVRSGKMREIDFRIFVATNALALTKMKADSILIEEALKLGRTKKKDQKIKYKSAVSDIKLDEIKTISQVKIDEHQQISQIDLDNKIREAENTVRIAIINEYLVEHQKIIMLQGQIDQFYEQIHEIENKSLPKELKAKMVADREANIEDFKKDLNARKARLIQIDNG